LSIGWSKLKAKTSSISEWLEQRLFAGNRKSERTQSEPTKQSLVSAAHTHAQNLIATVVSLTFIVAFVYGVYFYSNTMKEIEQHPLVTNLLTSKTKTRIHFALPKDCSSTSPDCWADPDFDDSSWTSSMLPREDLHTLKNYDEGVKSGSIYYRFKIPATPDQLKSGEELAFSPVFVSHSRYTVFVNGRIVQTGSSLRSSSAAIVISIPSSDFRSGIAIVGIHASLEKTDKGIRHPNGMYVGPKTVLDDVYVFKERALSTYFLLFLLTKGAIFVVFSLFFFFSIDRRALFNFLLYAFCVTLENALAGNFLANYLDAVPRVSFFFLLKITAISCLLNFFVEIFQAARARRKVRIWNAAMIFLVLLMVIDFGYGTRTVTGTSLFQVTNYLLGIGLAFGIGTGFLAIRLWKRMHVEPRKIASLRLFVAVIGTYLALIVWEFVFNSFVGFDNRAVFDLMFFVFVAFITAKEFGFNAGQVTTLESHMQEKRRMEAELQEAAEIAKAFLPGQLPKWDFCDIGIYHKALSESSGDWYTFENSPSGRFCHFVLCDITGHGVQAALVASTCRTVLSAMKLDNPACVEKPEFITDYARALNHILFHQGGGHHVSTFLGLSFCMESGKMYYVTGGHPNPLVISTNAEGVRNIKPLPSRHSVLGTSPTIDHALKSVDLGINDEVLAFSDGLPVGSNLKILRQMIQSQYTMNTAATTLYNDMWKQELEKNGKKPDDDVSVLWLRRVA
jgi:serine phosphatase RsbU (regulator of sigma subunit)